jgi:hypothetical protein
MIDLHLINTALAVLGISAGAAVLIAAAIITIAAMRTRRPESRRSDLAVMPGGATADRREPALR